MTPKRARTSMVGAAGVAALCAGLLGCREGRYAPDAKFVNLYVELKLASVALTEDLNKASEVRRAIIAQHDMTPAEFHEHYVQLAGHPEAWRGFQEQVVSRIDAFQKNPKGEFDGR